MDCASDLAKCPVTSDPPHAISDTQQTILCERCQALELESYVERGFAELDQKAQYRVPKSDKIADIMKTSLRNDCYLCSQFSGVFKMFTEAFGDKSGSRGLQLYWYRPMSVRWAGIYFGLRCLDETDTDQEVLFIPEEAPAVAYSMPLFRSEVPPGQILSIAKEIDPEAPDFEAVKEWLQTCLSRHARGSTHNLESPCEDYLDLQRYTESPIRKSLRVIDCKTRKLCIAPISEPYICLSYVWGNGTTDPTDGWALPKDIPKTIEDAITVVNKLGMRYLWVDRYCIDQDDPTEKHNLISNMDKVYYGAAITIIDACGNDPHGGLPGISRTRRQRPALKFGRHKLIPMEKPKIQIEMSKWNRRAWTYQEMTLSRRRLVFTDSQLYFQCFQMFCLEGISWADTDQSDDYTKPFDNKFSAFMSPGLGKYRHSIYDRLWQYYPKHLSFKSDAINAFAGIIAAFHNSVNTGCSMKHFYGITIMYGNEYDYEKGGKTSFLSALMWWHDTKEPPTEPEMRQKLFPSWSWASMKAICDAKQLGRLRSGVYSHWSMGQHVNDISMCVTHQSGNKIDIPSYTLCEEDYLQFEPCIEITTWTIEGFLYEDDERECYRELKGTPAAGYESQTPTIGFLGANFDIVFLDFGGPWTKTKLQAVYLGIMGEFKAYEDKNKTDEVDMDYYLFALLVREIQPQVFRRVGLYLVVTEGSSKWKREDVFAKAFKSSKVAQNGGWKMHTLRLI